MTRRIVFLLVFLLVPLALASGCAKERTVQLGAVLPLTGEYQIYGRAVQKGVELAYDELAAQHGSLFQLSVVDSESEPAKAKELVRQQYEDGALAVVAGVTTEEALQSVPIAEEFDRVLLSPSASNPELTGISKYFYRVFISDAREGTTMANFATQKLKEKNVVILAKQTAYAKGVMEVFRTEFERQGGEVLEAIEFPEGTDVTGLVDRVMTLQPDSVYLAARAQAVASILEELRRRNYRGSVFTTSAFAAPEVLEQVGAAANGVFLTQSVFDLDGGDETISAFDAAFREKYGLAPDLYAAHGYDSVMVLAAAAMNDQVAPPDFWRAMRGLRDYVGVTGTLQFDERGDVQKFPRVYVVSQGDLLDYEAEVERRRRELLERLRELEQRRSEDD